MKNFIKRVSQFVIVGALTVVVFLSSVVPVHASYDPQLAIGIAQLIVSWVTSLDNNSSNIGDLRANMDRVWTTVVNSSKAIEVSADDLWSAQATMNGNGVNCKVVAISGIASSYTTTYVVVGVGYTHFHKAILSDIFDVSYSYSLDGKYLHNSEGYILYCTSKPSALILDDLSEYLDGVEGFLRQLTNYTDGIEGALSNIYTAITSLGTKLDTMNTTLTNILYNMTSYHMVDGNYREWQLDEIIWAIYGSSGAIENLSTSINNKLDSLTSPIVNVSVDGDTTVDVDLSSLNTNITLRAGEIVSAVNAAAYDDSALMSKLSDIEGALTSIACHHEYRTQRTIEGSSLTFEAVSEDDPISNVTATLPVRLEPYNGFSIQHVGDTQSTAYAVDWSNDYPDIVTGGRYDLDTGILTVTHIYWSLRWGSVTNNEEIGETNARNFSVRGYSIGYGNAGKLSISTMPYAYDNDHADYPHFYCNYSGDASSSLRVFMPADTDGDTVLTFALQLATPLTYQLTPLELTPFVGNNTLTPSVGTLSMTILDGQYLTDMGYDLIVCQKCGQIEPIFDYSKLLDRLDDFGSTSLYTSADLSALVESVQSIQEWLENANLENNTTVNNVVNNYVDEVNVSIDSFGRILDLFVDAADFGHLTPDWFGASSYFANLGHDPVIDLGGE